MQRIQKASAAALGSLLAILPFGGIAVAAVPSVSYTSTGTTPFSVLSVAGSGFSPGETVQLFLGLSSATVPADATGAFAGVPLTIPSLPSGLYFVIAMGQTSGLVAFSNIFVDSFFPTVAPSSWFIAPGTTLTWSGAGFAPNEGITVTDSLGITIASFNADASGSFADAGGSVISFALRNSLASYIVRGATSGVALPITIGVSDLYPFVIPSTWYAPPASSVTFSGSGFGAHEEVGVHLGTEATPLALATADASGSFAVLGPVTLPFGVSIAEYRVVGHESGVTAVAPITLAAFFPLLSPSAYYAAPGSQITLAGSGFAGNEPVVITIGGVFAGSATTTGEGTFGPMPLTLPATPNMPVAIGAVGGMSGAATSFTMTVGQYYPDVVPSAWFTYSGNSVTFSGSGFGPNEIVTMSGTASGTTTTDGSGSFFGLVATIPTTASGTADFTFIGANSGATSNISIALGVRVSAIWFDNYYAQGGSFLTVFGAGFGNNESVELSANGSVFATALSDGDGNLAAATSIPYAPAGELSITATGVMTGTSASASLTVAPVYIDLQLGSYAVAAGSPVTFIGHGYLPNDPISITTDRTGSTVVASFAANASGDFSDSSFLIPADWISGNLTVTAHSGYSFTDIPITLWVIGL